MLIKADTVYEASLLDARVPATVPRMVCPVNCVENLSATAWLSLSTLQMLPVLVGFAGLLLIVALVDNLKHHAVLGASAAEAVFFYLFTLHCVFTAYVSACCDRKTRAMLLNDDVYTLRRRTEDLCRWGHLLEGQLTSRRGDWLSVSYQSPTGSGTVSVHHFRVAPCFAGQEAGLELGARVPLLIEPSIPSRVTSPWSFGVVLEENPRPRDRRTSMVNVRAAQRHELVTQRDPPDDVSVPLTWSWRQRPLTCIARLREVIFRHRNPRPAAQLLLERGRLKISGAHGREGVVDLNAPFYVHLSTWLVSDTHAELNVEISGGEVDRESEKLRFRVLLRHEQVSESLPLMQSNAPVLSEDALGQLLPILRHCEEAQYESLSAVHLAA